MFLIYLGGLSVYEPGAASEVRWPLVSQAVVFKLGSRIGVRVPVAPASCLLLACLLLAFIYQ